MAAIMRGAEFIITHDSPMLEIAQILEKQTFAIFGPTTSTLPASDLLTILENKGLSCRPCQPKLRNYCPLNHFHCMKDIDLIPLIHASKTP
jgi:ADP-heptose:LPS heptosyltransferase